MPLTTDLISEFVEVSAQHVDVKKESTLYGTIVEYDDTTYVRLDGSDLLTPIASTAEVADGQRVMVMIKNHSATVTGNLTDNSASGSRVNKITKDVVEANRVVANTVEATNVLAGRVEAVEGNFTKLDAKYATIQNLEAANAEIDNLKAEDVTISGKLTAQNAEIETLKSTKIDTTTVNAEFATIKNLEAANAEINSLKASHIETNKLIANKADIEHLHADYATIDRLESTEAVIENLDNKYANIDFANVGEATFNELTSKLAIIQNGTFQDGTFTGDLVAVNIDADLIKTGVIKADRLLLRGEDGLYYKLNMGEGGVTYEGVTDEELQNALHGSNIIANSITADKISVSDLVAFCAKIGGFTLTDSSIYSGVKSSADNTTRGIYMDSNGQMSFGDMDNYVRFVKDKNDDYKLDISADSVSLSTGETLKDAFNRITVAESNINVNKDAIDAKVSVVDFYGLRRFDGGWAQCECLDRQGVRIVGELKPMQHGEGDPSPENIRTIYGRNSVHMIRSKKNLVDASEIYPNAGASMEYTNGSMRAYSTEDGQYRGVRTMPMVLRTGVTHTLSAKVTSIAAGSVRVGFRYQYINKFIPGTSLKTSTGDTILSVGEYSITFTPSEDIVAYLSFLVTWDTVSAGDATFENIQLEMNSEATPYEAFDGKIYEMDFDGTTVYGGTVDVNTGELTTTMACYSFDGTENTIAKYDDTSIQQNSSLFRITTLSDSSGGYGSSISSHFTNLGKAAYTSSSDGQVGVYSDHVVTATAFKNKYVRWGGPNATVEEFKAWLAEQNAAGTPVQICYTLENPVVTELPPHEVVSVDGLNIVHTSFDDGYIEFGHESLDGLGGATMYEMTTQLNMKAGTFELTTTSDRLGEAEAKLTQLANSISMLVRDQNGESLMTQDGDGWIFSIAGIQSKLNDASSSIKDLQEASDSTSNNIANLKDTVDKLGEYTDYIHFGTYNDKPCITLGETDSNFSVVITNTDIQFKEGNDIPASISNQALNIDTAVIKHELRQGGFAWVARSNGNYGLLWKGE